MATTRRPQINHKACSHAATPKARKACRMAQRTAEQFWVELSENPAVSVYASPELHAWGVAQDNADDTARENGFAEHSEAWYQVFQATYLETIARHATQA